MNRKFFFRKHLFIALMLLASTSIALAQADTLTTKRSKDAHSVVAAFLHRQAKVRYIYQVTIHPAATALAWCADGAAGTQEIYKSSLLHSGDTVRISAGGKEQRCSETEPQWSPNGRELAFLSDAGSEGQMQVFIADATTGVLNKTAPLTQFDGYVSHLRWSPDGNYLSVLYVEKASREPSPMAAENRAVGLIDSIINRDVQRIFVVNKNTGESKFISPQGLYVYEYDWSPDSKQFVYTAAQPPGDDNWYIAKLYKQTLTTTDTTLLYQPTFQLAVPRWSPNGKKIAFIEGLMSDQGGTGGDLFTIASSGTEKPENLTANRSSSLSCITWLNNRSILFTEFTGGSVAAGLLDPQSGATRNLWKADASIRSGSEETSLAVANSKKGPVVAFTSSAWDKLPEVYAGTFDQLIQLTQLNPIAKDSLPKAVNVEWKNEGWQVQGWLLYPQKYDSTKKYPMLVCVHGGPAWITTPTWSAPDFNTTVYTKLGYFVFFPNPRGSHGRGESFTQANRRDWGFGDLRDILSGVDEVAKKFPVDTSKLGILGWSYGGSMAMFAITQTNRFKAAVAGAGAADWLSYYGQNRIDKWMNSYFNASPYEDPAAYAKSSAITYIKKATTPTLLLVGERDGEAPSPQSFQFWHALKELHVPTQLMVYPDEGHSFEKFENMIDVSARTIEWFNRYLGY